jgi:hypothetical protein
VKSFAEERVETIRSMAVRQDWMEIDHQSAIAMVSFVKGDSRINVYYSRMTVATVVDHPRFGRNQMFRKNVPLAVLEEIFRNPRIHSLEHYGIRGYHQNGKHLTSLMRKEKKNSGPGGRA